MGNVIKGLWAYLCAFASAAFGALAVNQLAHHQVNHVEVWAGLSILAAIWSCVLGVECLLIRYGLTNKRGR
jgi:hypothetical protein